MKQHMSVLALRVNFYYDQANKEKIDDSRRWNLKLKLKWGPKTDLQLLIIAIGAAKDNKMKIFEIICICIYIYVCVCVCVCMCIYTHNTFKLCGRILFYITKLNNENNFV